MRLLEALLIINGILLTFTSLAWAGVFKWVLDKGSYIVYEPDMVILRAEFYLALLLALVGLASATVVYIKRSK